MQKLTHLVFAFLLFLVANIVLKLPMYMSVFVFIGAAIPDLDLKLGGLHRKAFHNIWFLMILLFVGFTINLVNPQVSIALIVGFMSHLISDSLTHMGIMPLWPIEKPKFNGPFVTGSKGEMIFLAIIIAAIAFIIGGAVL